MQAVFITGHGGNEVVAVGERPKPVRGPGEVLVRLQAATLNQVDLYMRDSGAGITHRLPQIMGLDGAGIVEEVDATRSCWRPASRSCCTRASPVAAASSASAAKDVLCTAIQYLGEHRDGTLAEYVSVPARNVFPMPAGLSYAEAAALGVNHLTAWRMLFTKAQLKPWETVLIFGVGGGVSLAALQLARLAGARVIVTSRTDAKLQRALQLGAAHAIDSSTRDVAKEVMALTAGRGVDVVIENVGAAVWSSAMKSLVRGGRLVTCGATSGDQPPADLRRIFIRQLQILGSTLGDLDEFAALLSLVRRTGLRPVIDAAFPIAEAHAALDRLGAAERFGKVAITIADGSR